MKGKCPCARQSARCYNFVVVGGTGAGKTTLIDSFINYLFGIDFYDTFRYKLIDEYIKDEDKHKSQTRDTTVYHIKFEDIKRGWF